MLYQKRYRVESTRLPHYDYSQNGYYFITICTHNRYPWFGHIDHQRMCVNDIGTVIYREWYKTEIIRPYVILDQFVVMPDHLHGIIICQCV